MSNRGKCRSRALPPGLLLLSVVLGLGALRAWACGPFFPNQVLNLGDEALLALPVASFARELDRIAPDRPVKHKAVPPPLRFPDLPHLGGDVFKQTAEVDVADLRRALAERNTPPAEAQAIAQAYTARRRRDRGDAFAPPALPDDLPASLPQEFYDYLQGAEAWHQGELGQARAAWHRLLTRPAPRRRYRSTWAAFMIGKSYLGHDADRAIMAFELTRALADHGFADSLGLAAASLGWQAKAEMDRGNLVQAIDLYLTQHHSGDPTAMPSLMMTAARLMQHEHPQLAEAAHHPRAGRVVTAFLLARGGLRYSRFGVSREAQQRWLGAVIAAGVQEVVGAERFAWLAYEAGEMEAAGDWAERAPAEAPIALWVRAKLAMRAGRLEEATGLLARAARHFPSGERWEEAPLRRWDDEDRLPASTLRGEALGEAGALTLGRGQYLESLELLLASEIYWSDAAYVAERVLTTDELLAYVLEHHPQPPAEEAIEAWDYPGNVVLRLRDLLARRLTREGRWREARPFYAGDAQRAKLDAYIAGIRGGHDRRRGKAERAAMFWAAARIAREDGMELLGTELAPDHAMLGGHFALRPFVDVRMDTAGALVSLAPDEVARARRHAPVPDRRWHYRYIALDHAWAAAELLPDNSEELATILYTAGRWVAAHDPQAADRFYKALVRRCGDLPLGQEADRLRWFPSEAFFREQTGE